MEDHPLDILFIADAVYAVEAGGGSSARNSPHSRCCLYCGGWWIITCVIFPSYPMLFTLWRLAEDYLLSVLFTAEAVYAVEAGGGSPAESPLHSRGCLRN